MKKLTIFILIVIFCIIAYFSLKTDNKLEVLKVVSPTEFYVDFNKNKIAEENELIQLFELDTQPENLSKSDTAKLNYLAEKYAKDELLNKKITIIKTLNKETKIILPTGNDYAQSLINKGYVLTQNNKKLVEKNLQYANNLNLVSYNSQSGKYHKLNCKYALKSSNEKIVQLKDLPKNAQPCKVCHLSSSEKVKSKTNNKYPKDIYEVYSPIYKDKYIEFYITDFTKYFYPSNKCLTTPCKSLLKEINNAQNAIDFAIYGIDNQPAITNALINAHKRGVKIRWIYDVDKSGKTIYLETFKLKKIINNAKSDIEISQEILPNGKIVKDGIMHNKFFIFDKNKVWTGSANISHTDLSGFNANSIILLKSKEIAQIYENEFEQMYNGNFHSLKTATPQNKNYIGNSEISVYFSPQDKVITKQIMPLIKNAKKYIYIPVFVITHKEFNTALIEAKNRGVDIKVIVDATSAGSKYSSVKLLRENGIKIKTENRAGKMHMKSIIIDDNYAIIGSMNFSKSGESYNDENVIIIKNTNLAKLFKEKFLYFYQNIPDKWLYKNPGAESKNSINSCYDGIDNDFDGKTDMQDDSCNYKLKNQ